jgi:hypothetical protein
VSGATTPSPQKSMASKPFSAISTTGKTKSPTKFKLETHNVETGNNSNVLKTNMLTK